MEKERVITFALTFIRPIAEAVASERKKNFLIVFFPILRFFRPNANANEIKKYIKAVLLGFGTVIFCHLMTV